MARATAWTLCLGAAAAVIWPAAAVASVDYGPISHKGMKKVGTPSGSLQLPLQLGLVANQSGIQKAVRSGSDPTSSSYGTYPSLSQLQSSYGASSSKRKGVVNAFKGHGVEATVDVTHLRVGATVTVRKAQKLFGTKWATYEDDGSKVALPVNTPKLPKGIKGNVDTVAGLRHQYGSSSASAAAQAPAGGTPTRTGTPDPGCAPTGYPAAFASGRGLFPGAACSRTRS